MYGLSENCMSLKFYLITTTTTVLLNYFVQSCEVLQEASSRNFLLNWCHLVQFEISTSKGHCDIE